MDLERLPSGKFATNATMLSLGLVAYNILRLCGQTALEAERAVAARGKAADPQDGVPPAVAERDPGLDVLGGAVDASRPSARDCRFGGTVRGMGCGGRFTSSSAVGVARPRNEGEQHGERKSTNSVGARENPCAEWDSQAKILAVFRFRGPRRETSCRFPRLHFFIEAVTA